MAKRPREESASRPTVFDVADAAGVSTATVSRVLNGSADVSQALKDKVTQTIETLGYVRDSTARALATKRTFRLGLILPIVPSESQSEILQGFEEILASQVNMAGRYCTLFARSTWQVDDLRKCLIHLREHGAEGAFALGELPLQALGAIAHSGDFALVGLSDMPAARQPRASGATSSVSATIRGEVANPQESDRPDAARRDEASNATPQAQLNAMGQREVAETPSSLVGALCLQLEAQARKLAAHLLALGHRQVVIAGPRAPAGLISDGFVAGIKREFAHQHAAPPHVLTTSASLDGGAQALSAALELGKAPTVFLGSISEIGLGALFEAQRRGIEIPGDISLGGVLSPRLASAASPSLSGIEINSADIGKTAALNLIDRVEGRFVASNITMPLGLTIRDSFAPPKLAMKTESTKK